MESSNLNIEVLGQPRSSEEASPFVSQDQGGEIQEIPQAFVDSDYARMSERQKASGRPLGVLFTDIDNTFYRPDRPEVSSRLFALTEENHIPIVAITGNNFEVIKKRIESGQLPHFSVVAGSVGTEIWVLHASPDGSKYYVKDKDFEAKLVARGFNRIDLANRSRQLIINSQKSNPSWGLNFQHPDQENLYLDGKIEAPEPYKISFHVFISSPQELEKLKGEFESEFTEQEVVICEEINHNDGLALGDVRKKYNVDILPVTKASVVNYLQEKTRVDISAVAGDSGNDNLMLVGAGDIAIQVGGSKPELIAAINGVVADKPGKRSFAKASQADGSTKIYFREKGRRLGPESILYAAEVLSRAQSRFGNSQANGK